MRVLITGAGGFLAGHLLAHLQAISEIEVRGLSRIECDLSQDTERLASRLKTFQPDRIFHLAGRINGSESELVRDNRRATQNLFEATRSSAPAARIVLGSTAAVYGSEGTEHAPLSEEHTAEPRGAYAASKYAAEQVAEVHFRRGGWVVTARMSNPVGSNMNPALFCGTLAKQIVEIERGKVPVLKLRDLRPKRDFVSAMDCARALWQMSEFGRPGEIYNVASGTATPIAQIVDIFRDLAQVRSIEVDSSASSEDRSPLLEQWLSNARLVTLGWKIEQTVREAIRDQLAVERARV